MLAREVHLGCTTGSRLVRSLVFAVEQICKQIALRKLDAGE